MSQTIELTVHDLGNFSNIDVIEVLVQPGQQISKDTPLLTLETDKAATARVDRVREILRDAMVLMMRDRFLRRGR